MKKERIATAACALPRNDSAALSQDSDPASRAGRITWAQYSRLMLLCGYLEGVAFALEPSVSMNYCGKVAALIDLVIEIMPTGGGKTDCHGSVRDASQ